MSNPFRQLLDLLPSYPLQVGQVSSIAGGVATIALPGGGSAQARGSATVGANVFFRDGVIEGTTSSLPIELIDV
jgi:hypothetical protein